MYTYAIYCFVYASNDDTKKKKKNHRSCCDEETATLDWFLSPMTASILVHLINNLMDIWTWACTAAAHTSRQSLSKWEDRCFAPFLQYNIDMYLCCSVVFFLQFGSFPVLGERLMFIRCVRSYIDVDGGQCFWIRSGSLSLSLSPSAPTHRKYKIDLMKECWSCGVRQATTATTTIETPMIISV